MTMLSPKMATFPDSFWVPPRNQTYVWRTTQEVSFQIQVRVCLSSSNFVVFESGDSRFVEEAVGGFVAVHVVDVEILS